MAYGTALVWMVQSAGGCRFQSPGRLAALHPLAPQRDRAGAVARRADRGVVVAHAGAAEVAEHDPPVLEADPVPLLEVDAGAGRPDDDPRARLHRRAGADRLARHAPGRPRRERHPARLEADSVLGPQTDGAQLGGRLVHGQPGQRGNPNPVLASRRRPLGQREREQGGDGDERPRSRPDYVRAGRCVTSSGGDVHVAHGRDLVRVQLLGQREHTSSGSASGPHESWRSTTGGSVDRWRSPGRISDTIAGTGPGRPRSDGTRRGGSSWQSRRLRMPSATSVCRRLERSARDPEIALHSPSDERRRRTHAGSGRSSAHRASPSLGRSSS